MEDIKTLSLTVSDPIRALDKMLISMIEQLDKEFLKPVTLKKVIENAKKCF